MVKAVLFDMDGTLIDTEKYYRIFWPMALKQFGYEMTDEQALSMRSLGQPYAPQHLKDMFHDPDMDYNKIQGISEKNTWRSIWKRWVLSLSPVQLRYLHI